MIETTTPQAILFNELNEYLTQKLPSNCTISLTCLKKHINLSYTATGYLLTDAKDPTKNSEFALDKIEDLILNIKALLEYNDQAGPQFITIAPLSLEPNPVFETKRDLVY